jgi:hypothetical protein
LDENIPDTDPNENPAVAWGKLRGRPLKTAEDVRKWLASSARKWERGEITASQLEVIGKHASRLLVAVRDATDESGIREFMELHEGCLQGRCGTSRRAS